MDVVALTQKLIRINSENPPGREAAVGGFVCDYLHNLGLRPVKQKVGPERFNILAVKKGGARGIMMQAHLDTVPIGTTRWGRKHGEMKSGRIYGRGACDMKGPLAAMLKAVEENLDKETRRVALVFTVDEECGFLGVKKLAERKSFFKGIPYGVNGEPTSMRIGVAHKGLLHMRFATQGIAKHGSSGDLKNNAIVKMNIIMNKLLDHAQKLKKVRDPLVGSPSINLGIIKGGTKSNIVADHCELDVDRRVIPSEKLSAVGKTCKKRAKGIGIAKLLYSIEPFTTGKGEIIRIVEKACRMSGIKPVRVGLPYATEAVEFKKLGIHTVIMGPGSVKQAHTTDEFIPVNQLKKAVRVYSNVINNSGNKSLHGPAPTRQGEQKA